MKDAEESAPELIKSKIRDIADFPREGIVFKDITTVLRDPVAFKHAVDLLARHFEKQKINYIAGIEARGFIFGSALAYKLGIGFIPIRKPGKLPSKTARISYDLEYGTDSLEIHVDAVEPGKRVLIVDDLLATGGTAEAAIKLVKKIGGVIVGIAFVVELEFLKGREKLPEDCKITRLISF
ncbi:MAG: adenine phosphoribosyltransferase [Candidatus Melainabacteria bacterium RIFCSPLOWO2_02_FULL_35_15]|nr:MAG: adenine phosphoribosyltransferase [Candidatus Melainabacteria bacterium RIFCSPLOWO2_12_FULL_35_11]OGI13070.1 MAG: adenine phosphoribosyltransferase [Candidatus Melainabacteria bacterium RIFCSPLOWO2_02_FULL_35_15]